MTNFIFKSQGTYKKLCLKLEIIQSELRHNRVDNAYIIRQLNMLVADKHLQTQVDDFYKEQDENSISSPPPEDRQDID